MSIEAISRFNGGNGGVSIITHDLGGREAGQFLNPVEALEFGIEVIRKAYGSVNQQPPQALEKMVMEHFRASLRMTLPVNKVDSND